MEQRDSDFRPNRGEATVTLLKTFISDFFSENPLAHLAIAVLRDGKAEKVCDLTGSKRAHLEAIASGSLAATSGDASIQNGLELGLGLLREIPDYGHREILVVFGSLGTRDPGDVFATLERCRKLRVHVSVVGLGAEVFVLRAIAERSGGAFGVAGGVDQLQRLLAAFVVPPPTTRYFLRSLFASHEHRPIFKPVIPLAHN